MATSKSFGCLPNNKSLTPPPTPVAASAARPPTAKPSPNAVTSSDAVLEHTAAAGDTGPSVDTDTVAVLRQTADKHGCDRRWSVVRGSEADVRKIAAVLGVQYRRLTSGEFNHSAAILLLDGDGRIVKRSATLGAVDPDLLAALRQVR